MHQDSFLPNIIAIQVLVTFFCHTDRANELASLGHISETQIQGCTVLGCPLERGGDPEVTVLERIWERRATEKRMDLGHVHVTKDALPVLGAPNGQLDRRGDPLGRVGIVVGDQALLVQSVLDVGMFLGVLSHSSMVGFLPGLSESAVMSCVE